jgi:hypothetical protein
MEAAADTLKMAAGEPFEPEPYFSGEGDITVRRVGQSRARHRFIRNDRTFARLRWRGMRRATYQGEGIRLDLSIGPLDRRIAIVSEDGGKSFLIERSRGNPRRDRLKIEMAEGDNFYLTESWDSRFRSEAAMTVYREFNNTALMIFRFHLDRRTQTTVRVRLESAMKYEARFAHRLLALVVCRIILDRRHSGLKPERVKEAPIRFASSLRVRERKRFRG